MRLDHCRMFTPTKLAYVLERGEKEEKDSDGGASPDVVEVLNFSPVKSNTCSVIRNNCVKRNLFDTDEKPQSTNEFSLIRHEDANEEVTFDKRRTLTDQDNREEHETIMEEEGETVVDKMEDIDQVETNLKKGDFRSDSNDCSLFDDEDDLDEIFKCISVNYDDDGDVSHDSHVTLPPRYEVTTVSWERYRDENNGRTTTQIVLNLVPFSKYKEEEEEKGEDEKILCYLRDDW